MINFTRTKIADTLTMVSLGDIHLGHPKTPTSLIIKNLDRYCTNETVLRDVDILVITGDLYDRLLSNSDENAYLIDRWITRLMFLCARLDVLVRIVEGTPSHDRLQCRFFTEQQANAQIPVDLHYATTLSIEYIERFNIYVLYVPDKWRPDTTETLREVQLEMRKLGLEQVDFAIMHGAFEYQLPDVVKEPTHDSDTYLALVRYFVYIGHVHLLNPKERILPAGSYDRLTHGEEDPKGFFRTTVRADGSYTATFIENKGAKIYKTLDCSGMEIKEANVVLREAMATYPKGSAFRIRHGPHDPISGDLKTIQETYPDWEWTLTKVDTAPKERETLDSLLKTEMEELSAITHDTILALTLPELERQTSDAATQQRCQELLKEIIAT